jgi:hypothetical protein
MVRKQPMTHNEFNHILTSINALSPDQMRRLARELESRIASTCKPAAPAAADAEESAFDVASRAGLIGCIKGSPRSPTDLSTNPKHMEGFGRE